MLHAWAEALVCAAAVEAGDQFYVRWQIQLQLRDPHVLDVRRLALDSSALPNATLI